MAKETTKYLVNECAKRTTGPIALPGTIKLVIYAGMLAIYMITLDAVYRDQYTQKLRAEIIEAGGRELNKEPSIFHRWSEHPLLSVICAYVHTSKMVHLRNQHATHDKIIRKDTWANAMNHRILN